MSGHYTHLVERRDAILASARMTPEARARAMGQRVQRMVAKEHRITVDLSTQARTVETTNYIVVRPAATVGTNQPEMAPEYEGPDQEEVAIVKMEIAALVARKAELERPWVCTLTEHFIRDATRLQAVFCEIFNEIQPDAKAPLTISRLKKRDRSKPVAWARSVCVLLYRKLHGGSEPNIARLFGYADHTSARHSIDSAPRYMRAEPVLAEVHARVLARYEAQQ